MTTLTFRSWRRSGVYDLTTTVVDGRRRGTVEVTVHNRAEPSDSETAMVPFRVLGPRDVEGLTPQAIVAVQPPAGTPDAETTKCPHVEFRALDLPWRFTPQAAAGDVLRPWIVLLACRDDEVTLNSDATVTVAAAALAAHPLTDSARWAHVDDSSGHRVARLVSERDLDAETGYLCVVVPAFTADGGNRWPAAPGDAVTLPVYHSWRFGTAPAGDFVSLAARLQPRLPDPTLGRAPVDYDRVAPAEELVVRGALAPVGAADAPLPQPVADDVDALLAPLTDPRGRPVVTLPDYGAAWLADGASWHETLNGDPRHRGVAGLGLLTSIRLQSELSSAIAAQAGALDVAAALVRHLTFGLRADRRLWQRRLPSDPLHRLWVLGPALRKVVTPAGSVHTRLADPERPIPPQLFSSAARRVLRRGPARVDRAGAHAADPRPVLEAANRCPQPPARTPRGLPHADAVARIDRLLEKVAETGTLPVEPLLDRARRVDLRSCPEQLATRVKAFLQQVEALARERGCLPRAWLTELLILLEAEKCDAEAIEMHLRTFDESCDDDSVVDLAGDLVTHPPERPCRPVDLARLAEAVTGAFDPTVADPLVVTRVLDRIAGLDDQPLTPPQLCPDLDLPLWRHLRDVSADWLLPGVQTLPADAATAVQTNPTFVDAFLVGANTQALEEMRWRNIPIRSCCTPLRMFWDRIDVATASRPRDIVGIADWAATSDLGAPGHQTPSGSSTDLVVVFRSPLFRRYPQTLVYTVPAVPADDGMPDWEADPDFTTVTPSHPVFQGVLGDEITFFGFDLAPAAARSHWIVLEEPPPGYRFRNQPAAGWDGARVAAFNNATHGAAFADAAFNDPTRVLIRGDSLVPEV